MATYIGTNNIANQNIYIGATQVSAAYVGVNQVY